MDSYLVKLSAVWLHRASFISTCMAGRVPKQMSYRYQEDMVHLAFAMWYGYHTLKCSMLSQCSMCASNIKLYHGNCVARFSVRSPCGLNVFF